MSNLQTADQSIATARDALWLGRPTLSLRAADILCRCVSGQVVDVLLTARGDSSISASRLSLPAPNFTADPGGVGQMKACSSPLFDKRETFGGDQHTAE